jgi:TrmH family RNA methyltransferase
MITKRTLKLIKSLQLKKYRKKYSLFLVEGSKVVTELIQSDYKIQTLLTTQVFLEEREESVKSKNIPEVFITDEKTLSAASHFRNNNTVLAVVSIPEKSSPPPIALTHGYVLALDDVKDPGNLGTIIRIADWYGIRHIVCSPETTDVYNPKVISASMGSFMRVNVQYADLPAYLSQSKMCIYAAYVNAGTNIHNTKFGKAGIILMGSESHGISPDMEQYVSQKINIPSFGSAESLNVSISAGIICDNILRIINIPHV